MTDSHGMSPVYLPDPWMVDFYGNNVGKYTVRSMDPMGYTGSSFSTKLCGMVGSGILCNYCIYYSNINGSCQRSSHFVWSYTYTKAEYVLQDNSMCSIQGLDHQPSIKLMKHIPPPQLSVLRVGSTSAGTRYRHFGFQSDGGLLWQLPGAGGCFGMRLEEMPRSWTTNKHEKTAQSKSWRMNGNFQVFFEEPVYFTIIIMFVTISTPRKTKKTLPLKNSRWKTILSFSKWSPF